MAKSRIKIDVSPPTPEPNVTSFYGGEEETLDLERQLEQQKKTTQGDAGVADKEKV